MLPQLAKIKGIHPGLILKRELERSNIKSSVLAMEINEHKQTISAIVNQKRGINPELSIKLANYFQTEADYFMLLQASYEVNQKLDSISKPTPNLNNIRKVLFWDTTFDKIDWDKNKKAIIKRVLERGNEQEKEEIISFYGKSLVNTINNTIKESPSFTRSFNKKRKQRIE